MSGSARMRFQKIKGSQVLHVRLHSGETQQNQELWSSAGEHWLGTLAGDHWLGSTGCEHQLSPLGSGFPHCKHTPLTLHRASLPLRAFELVDTCSKVGLNKVGLRQRAHKLCSPSLGLGSQPTSVEKAGDKEEASPALLRVRAPWGLPEQKSSLHLSWCRLQMEDAFAGLSCPTPPCSTTNPKYRAKEW